MINSRSARIALVISVVSHIGWMTWLSIYRWNVFGATFDNYASIDSAAYNTAHGRFMYANPTLHNLWGDHLEPFLLLLSGYYYFFDNYWFVFFYQSFTIGLAAIPLFLIAREMVKDERVAFLVALAYLVNGSVQMGALFDYHGYAHAGLLMGVCFYFLLKQKWAPYFIFGALLMIVREDMSLIFFMFGIYCALGMKEYKKAAWTWGLSLGYMIVAFFVVIPYVKSHADGAVFDATAAAGARFTQYKWLGETAWETIIGFLTKPAEMLDYAFSFPGRRERWMELSAQMGLLPIFSPTGLIMIVPLSLLFFFSGDIGVYMVHYHYSLALIPLWMIAVSLALGNLYKAGEILDAIADSVFGKPVIWILRILSGAAAVIWALAIVYFLIGGPFDITVWGVRANMNDLYQPVIILSIAVALFLLSTPGLAVSRRFGEKYVTRITALPAFFLVAINMFYAQDYGALPFISHPYDYPKERMEHAATVRNAIDIIPKGASLVADKSTFTHLHHNTAAWIYRGMNANPFPNNMVEYAVFDPRPPHQPSPQLYPEETAILDFLTDPDYGLLSSAGNVYVFKKGYSKRNDSQAYFDIRATFTATTLPMAIGENVADMSSAVKSARVGIPGKTIEGYLTNGPFITLERGKYTARFRLKTSRCAILPVARLEVTAQKGVVTLGSVEVKNSDFIYIDRWQEFEVPFSVDEDKLEDMEFRVFYMGGAELAVERIRVDMAHDDFTKYIVKAK